MKEFAVTSKSFHLYEAFKKECESMGWKYISEFKEFCLGSLGDSKFINCNSLLFTDKGFNSKFGKGEPSFSLTFTSSDYKLETQWNEAIERAKHEIRAFNLGKELRDLAKNYHSIDWQVSDNLQLELSKKDETIANLQQRLKAYVKEIEEKDKTLNRFYKDIEFYKSDLEIKERCDFNAKWVDHRKHIQAIENEARLESKIKDLNQLINNDKDYMDKYNTAILAKMNMFASYRWKVERIKNELDYLRFFNVKSTIKSIKEILNEKLI